jgi:hypothetical protein
MLTQHYLSILVENLGITCCNHYCLSSNFYLNSNHPWQYFITKLLIKEGRVLANGWTHPSTMTIFVHLIHKKCHPKSYHSDTNYHMTLDFIFSVVNLSMSSVPWRCSWVVDHATVTGSWFETEAKFQLILRIDSSAEKTVPPKKNFQKVREIVSPLSWIWFSRFCSQDHEHQMCIG